MARIVIKKFLLLCGGLAAGAGILLFILDHVFPLPVIRRADACVVTARDHTPLRAFADPEGIWRYPITIPDVTPEYIQALITYEDRWFYRHFGVNPISLARAMIQNLKAGKTVSGGSTLTMQVARMIDPHKRTLPGKLKQMARALQLEWHYSKNDILTLYLDHAPFGSNIEGLQAAAFTWLGKQASELSHAEAALLAVLPQAPSFYRPDRHPERAAKARDKVLDRMAAFHVWPEDIILAAKMEPVVSLHVNPPMIASLATRRLYVQNPRTPLIRTCLDMDLQIHIEEIVKDYISGLSARQSGAALVVNHRTLETIVYVGSSDFFSTERNGQVDMVTALRSPGSALKPFLYGMALDEGLIHSHSLLSDTPRFKQAYDPGNFSGGFMGPVSVTKALQMSLNIPAVQVLEAYGPRRFHDRLRHAGARLVLEGNPNLSMVLGGVGTSLESLVTLYTALARKGLAGALRLLPDDPVHERFLMSEGAAWIILDILTRPLPGFEGLNRLASHVPVAWKTGTSYGFRDAWAIGIMGDYIIGVWVGRPDGSPSPGQYGSLTAIPLLQQIIGSLPISDFRTPPPASVSKKEICWPLGYAAGRFPDSCFMKHSAWVLDDNIPPTLPDTLSPDTSLMKIIWVDQNGLRAHPACGGIRKVRLALWPKPLDPWLPSPWKRRTLIPAASDICPDMAALGGNSIEITSLSGNSVLTRPPGGVSHPAIPLKAIGGSGKQHWFLNRKPIAVLFPAETASFPMPTPGIYQLAVSDEAGNSDLIDFEVIGR